MNVLQWIQYQLDNCASTKEVIATDEKLRITINGTPLHYLGQMLPAIQPV